MQIDWLVCAPFVIMYNMGVLLCQTGLVQVTCSLRLAVGSARLPKEKLQLPPCEFLRENAPGLVFAAAA